MRNTEIPSVGDEYTFSQLLGYRLVQERPFECRPVCRCGECYGRTEHSTERVTERIMWMDNSIEIVGDKGSRATLVAPHGDACF